METNERSERAKEDGNWEEVYLWRMLSEQLDSIRSCWGPVPPEPISSPELSRVLGLSRSPSFFSFAPRVAPPAPLLFTLLGISSRRRSLTRSSVRDRRPYTNKSLFIQYRVGLARAQRIFFVWLSGAWLSFPWEKVVVIPVSCFVHFSKNLVVISMLNFHDLYNKII